VWYSKLELAKLTAALGAPDAEVIDAYLLAHEARRTRAESLCYLAAYLREHSRAVAAYPFARVAAEIPRPADRLFVDDSVYSWRAVDELAIAAYWSGNEREALALNQRLLSSSALPASERARVEKNLGFARSKLRSR